MAYLKPGGSLRAINWVLRKLKLTPVLVVVGRKSGNRQEVPVNVLEHEGTRYLISPRGETQWARNLRAAGQGELRTRKGTEAFEVTEITDEAAKPALIAAYREHWNSQTKKFWDELPNPADHPIFAITTSS
jgi:deazaflavin-dependent oxidoreductase (nitroreductase family)